MVKVHFVDFRGQRRVVEGERCELEFERTLTETLRIPVNGETEIETLEDTVWSNWDDLRERYGWVSGFPELNLVAVVVDGRRYGAVKVVSISETEASGGR